MRTPISTKINRLKYISGALTLLLSYDFIRRVLIDFSYETLIIQLELTGIVVFTLFTYYAKYQKHMEYDEDYLYIILNGIETKVAWSKIKIIKKNITKVNDLNTWKIDFEDHEGSDKNVRVILDKKTVRNFDTFMNDVKALNPKTKIITEARTI